LIALEIFMLEVVHKEQLLAEGGDGGGAPGTGSEGTGPSGTANTGGGGAGGYAGPGFAGGSGGSGVVVIRYPGSQIANGGTVTSSGGVTQHKFTSPGTFAVS
jgi:hypothetical protein